MGHVCTIQGISAVKMEHVCLFHELYEGARLPFLHELYDGARLDSESRHWIFIR